MEYRDVCFEIENDDFYRQFLSDKHCIEEELNTTEKVEKLTKGIEKLNSELETQVLSKHHDLLTQASHASNLEKAIDSMHIDAQSLLTGIEKLRSQVHIPYSMLESQTIILERVQFVCHLLRYAQKVIQLCKALKKLDRDPLAQASLLYEVELYLGDSDFTEIKFMDEYLSDTKIIHNRLIDEASHNLMKGLSTADKSLLLSSFQVFNNLHCAKERIDNIVVSVLQKTQQATVSAFLIKNEIKKLGDKTGPGKANFVNMQTYRVKFWENIEKLFVENYYHSCKEILLLQNALNDLNSLDNYNNVAKKFWEQLSVMFSTELKNCAGYANQCAELDYPKLLKYFNDLCGKLHHKDIVVQRELLLQWENYFLSKSLEKLLDPIRSMWSSNQVPSSDDIDSIIRVISNILSVSLGDKQLSISLATSIAKCIKQMAREAEERVCLESEVGQIIEAPSTAQQLNANISNILYYFNSQILRVLTNMSNILHPDAIAIIQDSLKEISHVAVLQPFCTSINNSIDLIIGSMHGEAELNMDLLVDENISYSLYLRELESFVTRCKDMYLSLYQDAALVNKCYEEIATHSVKTFIQNVCSLRPVSAYGRAKLQVDCKRLEVALQPLVNDLSSVECYRELRALNTLLGMTPTEIYESQSKGGSLPNSLVMILLFAHGEPDLLSPHQCVGWSQQKLLYWMVEHPSEKDRLDFIAGALQRYQTHIRQNNISKYDDVYPILIQLFESGKAQL